MRGGDGVADEQNEKNMIPETQTKKHKEFDVRNFDVNMSIVNLESDPNPFI